MVYGPYMWTIVPVDATVGYVDAHAFSSHSASRSQCEMSA